MSNQPIQVRDLYLEDSYFLGFTVSGTTVRLRALLALTQEHADHAPPRPGEQHCYREGEMVLSGTKVMQWIARKPTLSTDPDGALDLGSIAILEEEDRYRICTDWFDMSCQAASFSVTID